MSYRTLRRVAFIPDIVFFKEDDFMFFGKILKHLKHYSGEFPTTPTSIKLLRGKSFRNTEKSSLSSQQQHQHRQPGLVFAATQRFCLSGIYIPSPFLLWTRPPVNTEVCQNRSLARGSARAVSLSTSSGMHVTVSRLQLAAVSFPGSLLSSSLPFSPPLSLCISVFLSVCLSPFSLYLYLSLPLPPSTPLFLPLPHLQWQHTQWSVVV